MKKKLVFTLLILFVISLVSFVGIKYFSNDKESFDKISDIQENNEISKDIEYKEENITNSENKKDNQEVKVSENQKEQKNSKEEKIVEKKSDSSVINKETTTSSSTTTSNNKTTTNENKNVVEQSKQDSVVSEEKPVVNIEQPKPTNSYIGVPNPNDFYYSFHKGHIDKNYTTLDGCMSRTAEVSLIDTVDIINTTCFEVLDGQGTVLGIYMYVKCNSGNCERYKSLVGIETN